MFHILATIGITKASVAFGQTSLFTIAEESESLDYLALHKIKFQDGLEQFLRVKDHAVLGGYSKELDEIYTKAQYFESYTEEPKRSFVLENCRFRTIEQEEKILELENPVAEGVPVEVVDIALRPEYAFFPDWDPEVQGLGHYIQSGVAETPLFADSLAAFLANVS